MFIKCVSGGVGLLVGGDLVVVIGMVECMKS